ncbi:MFS transporter [Burkholderia thailandensis]|uniref:MFS transporter n=1 Tax=Burkholderia thailandensis TaxID=57975 RepID=UPI001376A394|nr:MFS transporter [Burkholderia thailandensis]NBJ19657.1 MFS transporter [Burkholderia thailandensis]
MDIKAPAVGARSTPRVERMSRVRFTILAMLFVVTTINYADRATISIAGSAMQKDLGIDAVSLGYIFSAFGWAYVIAQIPGGWLLDRFGSRRVYAASILTWSVFTLAQGAIGLFTGMAAIVAVFSLRFLVGIAEAPSFPANSRIVAAWFPANERGTASAIFNSAQYCINALTYFFITWFPVYLVQARGMSILKAGFVASVPAVCGFLGGILGGIVSDALLRRGASLSVARKVPIVHGMLLSVSMVVCNYVDTQGIVVAVMALAFFGKGMGALGWAVNSDTASKQIAGLSGALMNTFGNLSSITTPIAIGYIVNRTGSFNGALAYVGLHALVACVCYLFVVGEIKRVELKPAS